MFLYGKLFTLTCTDLGASLQANFDLCLLATGVLMLAF